MLSFQGLTSLFKNAALGILINVTTYFGKLVLISEGQIPRSGIAETTEFSPSGMLL